MELLLTAQRNAERALVAGVTTMRDGGSWGRISIVLRDAIVAGLVHGPHLVVSGPAIAITGGHAHYLGGAMGLTVYVRKRRGPFLKMGRI